MNCYIFYHHLINSPFFPSQSLFLPLFALQMPVYYFCCDRIQNSNRLVQVPLNRILSYALFASKRFQLLLKHGNSHRVYRMLPNLTVIFYLIVILLLDRIFYLMGDDKCRMVIQKKGRKRKVREGKGREVGLERIKNMMTGRNMIKKKQLFEMNKKPIKIK